MVILDNTCKQTVRVIQLESLLKCVISMCVCVLGGWGVEASSRQNVFQKQLAFSPQLCICLKFFPPLRLVRERVGWEGIFLSHAHSLLLETASLLFLSPPISHQSRKTKCGEAVYRPASPILMWTPSIISCAGHLMSSPQPLVAH